jgi:4-hydroxybenzoyl-CoA thioesterase
MAHIECDFLSPSKIGDMLTFRLVVKKIGTSSLTLAVEARSGEDVRVRATLVVVLASLDAHRPAPFPPALRARLERFRI